MEKKSYRCGHCGQPTNEQGEALSVDECKLWVEKDAILVHGYCCPPEPQRMQVTRDMAIDAGDLSLEGTYI